MDLFDIYQQRQIRHHSRALTQTAETASLNRKRASEESGLVEERIERLTLLCEAMWELLSEATDLTTEDLVAKVAELDQQDGLVDGRIQRQATNCVCGAKVNPKARLCQFCNAPAPLRSAFGAV